MFLILAKVTLDDVFKNTQRNMDTAPDSNRLLAILLGMVGIALLLILFRQRTQRQAMPKALHSPRRLLREVTRQLPIRSNELKQLKALSEQQECSSPLVLLMCPSLLAKGLRDRSAKTDRKVLSRLAHKVGSGG